MGFALSDIFLALFLLFFTISLSSSISVGT